MNFPKPKGFRWIALVLPLISASAVAANDSATITAPPLAKTQGFSMGSARHPDGTTLTLNSQSLLLNGRPWTPVMGEFHFSRYPANEWREELLKIKAGGIDIVATYVFWIHHEEVEGQFDWTERRDLRRFVQLCGEVGLKAIVRCGPWCHGEVRNGGQPDWLLKKGWKLRSDDTHYLAKVRILYGEIAEQLAGLLWKDGGPVIGIQFENEFRGPASHLLTLKKTGRELGLDVPLYTRTGWPALTSPMPFGEIAPLYGVYAEGFWDRELTPMPGRYWSGFHFSTLRTDANIANEILGRADVKDPADVAQYPYLTCEIGAGMMSSYHRRILFHPADADSVTLVKLGSGSTSPGYYMYHGGVNPEGKLSTLQESQATGYWNDLPVKNYDFQTALGEYGQIRPQYHSLRRLHLFLHDWGASFANMAVALPDARPSGKDDTNTLRWCVRSDGEAGFVFVNNYERLRKLPPKTEVRFHMKLPGGMLAFPDQPITLPSESRFLWPFSFDLAPGITLAWATAQPVCKVNDGDTVTIFFAETKGVPAQFAFAHTNLGITSRSGKISNQGDRTLIHSLEPGTSSVIAASIGFKTNAPTVRIVLLSEEESLALWKGNWQGREHVFLTKAGLVLDGDNLRLTASNRADLNVGIYPMSGNIAIAGNRIHGMDDGIFRRFTPERPKAVSLAAEVVKIHAAGSPREIPLGKSEQPVAAAPDDSDFAKAAVWQIKLPDKIDLGVDPILRLHYVGDVARVTLNGKLLNDDFYNGNAWEIGLRRHAPEILSSDLRVAILPLQKDAPIYLAREAQPDFSSAESAADLRRVEIIPRYQVEFRAAK